jgi:asparagine synthetase B (glutamine-hydrolysing)
MSGVAGVLGFRELPGASAFTSMLQAIPHRGSQHQIVACGSAILGVASHAEREDASIAEADGYAAAFVGVLDNVQQMERELFRSDSIPRDVTPARLVLEAVRRNPADVRRLRGAFSAVVTDGERLICLRDHIGFSSLFYRRDDHAAIVGSEAKQVIAGSRISKEPDLDVLESIFYQSYDDAMPCALRGVLRVDKASCLTLHRSGTSTLRFWDPEALLETTPVAPADLREAFDSLMMQAAERMVTRDCAVSLSGGIDSPAVAAYAAPRYRELTGQGLQCLTAIYPDHPSVDERRYTELVAKHLDAELLEYEQEAPAMDDLASWMQLVDGPVPAISLPLYAEHYGKVRSLGATTVLSGELAEFVVDTSSYLLPHLLTHRRFRALREQIRSRRARGHSYPAVARQLITPFAPPPLVRWRWQRNHDLPSWLDHRRANEGAVRSIVGPSRRWRTLQLAAFQGPGISAEAEQICQQVCGVQARRPWTDIDLWEFFLGLPAETKFPNHQRKGLVRSLLRGRVPDEILDRTDKTLFNESIMDSIDYDELGRWLRAPAWQMPGVDYGELGNRIDQRALGLRDFLWAKDLAAVHAFLAQW